MSKRHALKQDIEAIIQSYIDLGGINHLDGDNLPSRQSIYSILDHLKDILFPGYFQALKSDSETFVYTIGQKVSSLVDCLSEQIFKSLVWQAKQSGTGYDLEAVETQAQSIAEELVHEIPALRKRLKQDALATFNGDPAAKSEPEIILAYPGFQATTVYRIAHFLQLRQVPLIPRLMTEIVHSQTGIDIHPGATIGHHFCIDHGSGVVVGETSVIGNHVKLYQGVTLGALSVPKKNIVGKRHPTLEDHVTVYSGTTILGGETVIGHHSIVGGNVWIVSSIPPNSKVYLTSDQQQQILKTD